MKEQQQKFSVTGSFKSLKQYINSQLELIKLRAVARGARMIGALALDITKVLFVLLIFFFLSMALAFYLGELLGSNSLGFLAAAGVFLLLIFIINLLKKKLELKIMDIAVRKFLQKWDEEDEHLAEEQAIRLKRRAEKVKQEVEKIEEEIEKIEDERKQTT